MNNVNLSSIRAKVLNSKKMQIQADIIVQKKIEKARENFLQNLDNHPVSQELKGKSSAKNVSNTLGGNGNLFTFIGFEKSSDPIDDLKSIILSQFGFKKNKDTKKIEYKIFHPTLEKVRERTPMPWENGKSWVEGIEKGISGLSYYLFKRSKRSRSGNGLQAKKEVNPTSFNRTKFLSELIENFKKDIKK